MCEIIVNEYSHAILLIFEKLHYFVCIDNTKPPFFSSALHSLTSGTYAIYALTGSTIGLHAFALGSTSTV